MKKFSLTFLAIIISTAGFSQRSAAGNWTGTLDVGYKLRIVFHIKADSVGALTATMDSPDQGTKDFPVSTTILIGDSLWLNANLIKGSFNGSFLNDTTIAGQWSQGTVKLPLTLVRNDKIISMNRPQTPKAPFNYKSEDVEYDNTDKSVHFGGTLTFPGSGGPFPTAILITGSGQQDRDETIFGHKSFAVIADHLTKQGFAILRVDDRGVGKTSGQIINATSLDFANDVEAGIAYLRTRPEVDLKKIGMIGHSEGGLIASIIASRRKDINFIVLLASPGVKGSILFVEQSGILLKSRGISSQSINFFKPLMQEAINILLAAKDTSEARNKRSTAYVRWKISTPEINRKELGFKDDITSETIINASIKSFNSAWWRYFLETDPARLLEKTNAKVLALNGEKDIQVTAELNISGIRQALNRSGSKAHEEKILPGLNHLFQTCVECTMDEYAKLEETFSIKALAEMSGWLQKNVIRTK
jgi:uncharacterized protein